MTIFFTADTHFGDRRILTAAKRPFKTIKAHDEALIGRWQEAVGRADDVYVLGDFAPGFSAERLGALLESLPGRKHLIAGNNDDAVGRSHPGWASVAQYAEIVVEGTTCILCHYAFRTWYRMGKGSLDLHGHSHGKLKPLPRQFDVGVDLWDYRPVTLAAMLESRKRKVKSGGKSGEKIKKAA